MRIFSILMFGFMSMIFRCMFLGVNTLTALAPTLFKAAKEVQRERTGAIEAITSSFGAEGVAIGDVVTVPIAPAGSGGTYTPAMTTSAGTDRIAESMTVGITTNEKYDWNLTGEDRRRLLNGNNEGDWTGQMVKQGMRYLRNKLESELCAVAYKGASRAYGSAGTTPFSTTIDDLAYVSQIMKDNGAPMVDPQVILNSSAVLNMQKLGIYQQADAAGSDYERRTGMLKPQFGFTLRESAGIASHTKGTATGIDTIAAGEAIGQTTLSMEGSDAGTVLAGDVVTFSNHSTYKYVVNSGGTLTGAASGDMTIGRPGLRTAIADATEMTIGSNYTANLCFERSAIVGVVRPPDIPDSPLIKKLLITDDSGLSYLLCEIVGDGMITWRIHLAWGFKVINSEFVVNLLG